jgi:hypothetical protein
MEYKKRVEICAGDGTECNTTNLIVNHGFHGFLFDNVERNVASGRGFLRSTRTRFFFRRGLPMRGLRRKT